MNKAILLLLFIVAPVFAEPPDTLPITGPITSGFGYRPEGFGGEGGFHGAIDISAVEGTPVYATMSGTVIEHWPPPDARHTGHPVYGGCILIQSDDGWATFYAHLSRTNVHEGWRIEEGQKIGEVGDTGWSTGPHLHYEVRVDPLALIDFVLTARAYKGLVEP